MAKENTNKDMLKFIEDESIDESILKLIEDEGIVEFKCSSLKFKSKSSKPFLMEKNGPLYEGENWMFECDKKDFTYDEAWEQCNIMIERFKETESYDVGFIQSKRFNNFKYKFGVLFGRKLKGDK